MTTRSTAVCCFCTRAPNHDRPLTLSYSYYFSSPFSLLVSSFYWAMCDACSNDTIPSTCRGKLLYSPMTSNMGHAITQICTVDKKNEYRCLYYTVSVVLLLATAYIVVSATGVLFLSRLVSSLARLGEHHHHNFFMY